MRLFERLVEKTLERSPLLQHLVTLTQFLANEVENLTRATGAMAQIIQAHQAALQELYARQGLVMKAVASNSLDLKMPDGKVKNEPKPN